MRKKKRKLLQMLKKRKWIWIPVVLVIVVGIGAGLVLRGRTRAVIGMEGVIMTQSAQAEKGNIKTTVIGTGNLENADAQNIYLPEGVEIEEVMVSSGDHVEKGDVLAKLSASSIATQMLEVQEQISDLDEELSQVEDDTESETVTTKFAGRIKKIYAQEGDSVADIISEYGALALLSVDGKMAVEMENISSVSVGDTVEVILSDNSTVKEGTVASLEHGTCTVTLTDQGTTLGEQVTVQDKSGTTLGSGKLTIHQQLEITAAAGSVEDIQVSENEAVEEGETLMTLDGVPASAEYQELVAKREKLTQRLQSLMKLSKEHTLVADFSGTVQSVNISDNSTAKGSSDSTSTSTVGENMTGTIIGTRTAAASSKEENASFVLLSTGGMKKETESSTEEKQDLTETKTQITSITDVLQMPKTGKEAQTQILQEECEGQVEWTANGAAFQGIFQQGTVYTAKVTMRAITGYAFAAEDALSIVQEGASSVEWNVTEETLEISIIFKATDITSCALSIATPKAGEVPQTTIDETGLYGGTISWSPQPAVFAENTQYIAEIRLTAKEGYQFAAETEMSVTLNGNAVSQVSVSQDANQLILVLVYQIGADGTSKEPDSEEQPPQTESGLQTEGQMQTEQQQRPTETQKQSESQKQPDRQQQPESQDTDRVAISPSSGNQSTGGAVASGQSIGSTAAESAALDSQSSGEEDTQTITAMTVSPEEHMNLAVSVDELDILSIALDQKAEVTFDAIEDETFEGTITSISDTASVNGGVAKYTVEITIPKSDSMKVGMNASATITIEDKQDILLIPVSALQEMGDRVFVYTQKDEKTGALSGEKEVETGLSDGTNVEIVSGLEEGDTIYYTRTEAPGEDTQSFMGQDGGMMGGNFPMGDGQMPPGEMPSGGGPGGFGFPGGE